YVLPRLTQRHRQLSSAPARAGAGEAAGRDGLHLPRPVPGSRRCRRPCGVRRTGRRPGTT
ncbi:MAG: hypothetical protein MZW92_45010, partial [Comamonadaceae bacterium]|nr:hypothetical protein [Comamonadaceae bacterium]